MFIGHIAPYDLQGPLCGWWVWPDPETGILRRGATLWQFGALGADPRGAVVAPHAAEALTDRFYGVPAMSMLFHFALGFASALSLRALRFPFSSVRAIWIVLLVPPIALTLDPPVRLLCWVLPVDKVAAVSVILFTALLLVLFAAAPIRQPAQLEMALLISPLINHTFFQYHAHFGEGAYKLPPEARLCITMTTAFDMLAHMRAAGLLSPRR